MFFHIQGLCLWEHQDKLIATQAKNVPCWAQGLLQAHADAGEEFVTRHMADGIIDVLEVIQVSEEHRTAAAFLR